MASTSCYMRTASYAATASALVLYVNHRDLKDDMLAGQRAVQVEGNSLLVNGVDAIRNNRSIGSRHFSGIADLQGRGGNTWLGDVVKGVGIGFAKCGFRGEVEPYLIPNPETFYP